MNKLLKKFLKQKQNPAILVRKGEIKFAESFPKRPKKKFNFGCEKFSDHERDVYFYWTMTIPTELPLFLLNLN